MPGGESGKLALIRAMHAINEIARRARDGDVLIVCHGTIMRLIACELLGIEPDEYRRAFPAIPNVGRLTLQIISNPTEKNAKLNAQLIDP
jgi:probable phosphoglycerate mutase